MSRSGRVCFRYRLLMPKDENPYAMYPGEPSGSNPEFQAPQAGSNTLGIVGFVLSLLGPLALIGVVMCLVALRRRPRGFAIAGLVIGVVMLLLTALCGGIMGIWVWALLEAQDEYQEIASDYATLSSAISDYQRRNNGALPPDLGVLGLPAEATSDPYGEEYLFTPQGGSWSIGSNGADGVPGTDDDVELRSGLVIGDYMTQPYQPLQEAVINGHVNETFQ